MKLKTESFALMSVSLWGEEQLRNELLDNKKASSLFFVAASLRSGLPKWRSSRAVVFVFPWKPSGACLALRRDVTARCVTTVVLLLFIGAREKIAREKWRALSRNYCAGFCCAKQRVARWLVARRSCEREEEGALPRPIDTGAALRSNCRHSLPFTLDLASRATSGFH